jgi:hypothetical protein
LKNHHRLFGSKKTGIGKGEKRAVKESKKSKKARKAKKQGK